LLFTKPFNNKNEFEVSDFDHDMCGGRTAYLFCTGKFSRDKHRKKRTHCIKTTHLL